MKRLVAKYILFRLVVGNYKQRIMGELPDKWYWADVLLLKWGYSVNELSVLPCDDNDRFFVMGEL